MSHPEVPYLKLVPLKRKAPASTIPGSVLLRWLDRNRFQLFRGVCITPNDDNFNKWIYGDIIQTKRAPDREGIVSSDRHFIAIEEANGSHTISEIDPFSAGQYMHAMICDGGMRHLFEGDVIESEKGKQFGVCCRVVWSDDRLRIQPFVKGNWDIPLPEAFVELSKTREPFQAVPELDGDLSYLGNIYDNPELIGKNTKEAK